MAHRKTTRKSLGRSAAIGDLYDATTDSFCGKSIFSKLKDVDIETNYPDPVTHTDFICNDDNLFNNLIRYDVEPELAVRCLIQKS